jgi:transposase
VQLKKRDRDELDRVLNGGIQPVRVVLRSLTLCQLHAGKSVSEVAVNVHLTSKAVREIGKRYEAGLERALYDKQPGAQSLLDAKQRERIIAMVCREPPEGRARWTVRLITEEAVKRKLAPKVGPETIRILLLSHEFKTMAGKKCGRRPSSMKNTSQNGAHSGGHEKPYDPQEPQSAWMKNRSSCMPMSDLLGQLRRAGRRAKIVNTSVAAPPMSSALWSLS